MRDSPLSERSDIPLHLLASMARHDVKVLLSGEGSDELFGGYPKYAYDRFAWLVGLLPQHMVKAGCRVLPGSMRKIGIALTSLSERTVADRWAHWFSPFSVDEKMKMLSHAEDFGNPSSNMCPSDRKIELLDRMLYVDCKMWLPENLLTRGDRMTMAASVEGRVPFLDHEFVEFAFSLPRDVKIKGFNRKRLIKDIARRYLSREIIERPKKGFEVPLADWFRGKLRDMCYDRISSRNGLATELFKRHELQRILDEHCSGQKNNFLQIWTLLGLSIWHEMFCSNKIREYV
jgi:asparagine synthase (glutamine-hydrolysing)